MKPNLENTVSEQPTLMDLRENIDTTGVWIELSATLLMITVGIWMVKTGLKGLRAIREA